MHGRKRRGWSEGWIGIVVSALTSEEGLAGRGAAPLLLPASGRSAAGGGRCTGSHQARKGSRRHRADAGTRARHHGSARASVLLRILQQGASFPRRASGESGAAQETRQEVGRASQTADRDLHRQAGVSLARVELAGGDFGEIFDAFVNGVVDWKACLEAIRSCPVLGELMTGRPPKSILPHPYALMECAKHVLLWMAQSKVPVDTGFLTTYREIHPLPPPELVNDLAKRYKSEIMPKELLGKLRREFFMDCMGIKFHDQFGTVSCARDLYVKHGADPTRLPRPGKVLVKPMEDASGPEKMSHWFYTPGLIHLHRDLLSRTGFEDEYGYYSDSWSSDDEQDEE